MAAAAHITKAIRNIPLFQNANWINATLWLKMSNGVEGEKGGIRLDFTFDSSSLQFQEWLTPLCTKKFARRACCKHLCSFSYWISRLAKSQMRSTKGPTLYNCRESFFSVWKKEMERGKKKFLPEVVCGCSKKILSRRAVGDCNWLRNLCVNEESLAREIDFDTRLGTKRESQEGAKSKDSSYLKKQRGFFCAPHKYLRNIPLLLNGSPRTVTALQSHNKPTEGEKEKHFGDLIIRITQKAL